MKTTFPALFLLTLFLSGFASSAETSKNTNPTVRPNDCTAKSLPSLEPVKQALNNFPPDECPFSTRRFDEVDHSTKVFTAEFLKSYPKKCDSSKIKRALNDLYTESPAKNKWDAGRIYLQKISRIFTTMSHHVEAHIKSELEFISHQFVAKAKEHFPE